MTFGFGIVSYKSSCVRSTTCTYFLYWHIYRLVMTSINLFETAHFAHWKSDTTSETNVFVTIKFLFLTKNFFIPPYFVSDWSLSWKEFCLGLNFAFNHLIIYVLPIFFYWQRKLWGCNGNGFCRFWDNFGQMLYRLSVITIFMKRSCVRG